MAGAIHRSLMQLKRWQAALVLFASGALMALGFAPFYYWPVIFIALPIFYILLTASTSRGQAIWRGFYFGYGYSMAGTWWIGNALLVDAAKFGWMLPFSILGLSAAMAAWFMVFGFTVYASRARMSPLMFAVLWVIVELLRSVGMFGFPWNLVGYMSLASLPMAQMASLIGTYGLSLLVVAVGVFPAYMLQSRRAFWSASIITAMVIALSYGYGASRLVEPAAMTTTRIRIVQPNIPQEVKGTRAGVQVAAESLERLTSQKTTEPSPDIIIWPETAYPFTLRADKPILLPGLDGVLLTGAVRAEGERPNTRIWNSLVAISPSGDLLASYDKHQLVPFGEFVPLRHLLPLDKITPGDTDFSRGTGAQTIRIRTLPPFSPLVCYEGIFPWLAIDTQNRPDWILNVTNDGWYGDSPGPYQHFEMVRMRAIEQGLPVVRAANSGISAVVDGKGRITSMLSLNSGDILEQLLPKPEKNTFYAISNAPLIQLMVLFAVYFLLFFRVNIDKNR